MPVPVTELRTSHAITIRVANQVIGRIQGWTPAQARDVKPKYEINAIGTGLPVEQVPGVMSAQTLQISRYDLYLNKMEEIWGTPKPLYALTDQHNPIEIEEKWIKIGNPAKPFLPWMSAVGGSPFTSSDLLNDIGASTKVGKFFGVGTQNETAGIPVGELNGTELVVEKLWYTGCWFTNIGRNIQAQGDRMILTNASMVYTKVRPLL